MSIRLSAAALFVSMAAAPLTIAQQPTESPAPASQEAAKPADPLDRTTPQSAVFAFLDACRSKNFRRAARYLDLSEVPERQRRDGGSKLAEELGGALDRYTEFDVAALSQNPDGDREDGLPRNRDRVGVFNVNGRNIELQIARSELRSGIPVWRFPPETVNLIPKLAQGTRDSWIERRMPAVLLQSGPVNTAIWQWIALVLLAVGLGALAKLTIRVAHWFVCKFLQRVWPRANLSIVDAMAAPVQLLLAVAIFRIGMEWIAPSAVIRFFLGRVLGLLSVFGIGWLCLRLIDLGAGRLRSSVHQKHTFPRSILPLATRVVKIIVVVLAVTAVLGSWGYNTTTILAGLGIGGVAIALAAQKTIENLFGGVAVITDRPVHVGDFCKFGNSVGTVEDIGLRSTRIRTLDRTVVSVPNSEFSSMTLENFSRRDKIWFHPLLNLRRDTQPDQVREILQSIQKLLREHPKVEVGDLPVRFVGVGAYSLDIEVFAYVKTPDYDEFLRIQEDLLLRILDAVAKAGTALALPTQASVRYEMQADRTFSNSGPRMHTNEHE